MSALHSRFGLPFDVGRQVAGIRAVVHASLPTKPKRSREMDVHSTRYVCHCNGVDVVGRIRAQWPHSRRLIEPWEPETVAIDGLVDLVGNGDGRTGVGIVCVYIADVMVTSTVVSLNIRLWQRSSTRCDMGR